MFMGLDAPEGLVIDSGKQTPTDKYKVLLMDTLKRCIELDINLKDDEFVRCVDNLHNLMRLYAIHREKLVEKYNDKTEDLRKKLEDIQKGKGEYADFNDQQKEKIKLQTRYLCAKELLNIIIDMMNNSPIIEKEMEGLFYSPTSIGDYAKIRERILKVKVE